MGIEPEKFRQTVSPNCNLLSIYLTKHDFRRILTDYGFQNHYPLGIFFVKWIFRTLYNEDQRLLICETIESNQELHSSNFVTPR